MTERQHAQYVQEHRVASQIECRLLEALESIPPVGQSLTPGTVEPVREHLARAFEVVAEYRESLTDRAVSAIAGSGAE